MLLHRFLLFWSICWSFSLVHFKEFITIRITLRIRPHPNTWFSISLTDVSPALATKSKTDFRLKIPTNSTLTQFNICLITMDPESTLNLIVWYKICQKFLCKLDQKLSCTGQVTTCMAGKSHFPEPATFFPLFRVTDFYMSLTKK